MGINYGQRALEQLKAIQERTGWSRAVIAKKLDVGSGSMCNWLKYGKKPKVTGQQKIDKLYKEVFNLVPPEAPENLDEVVKKYCEEDEKAVREVAESHIPETSDLEPTSLEQLNPPDLSEINQKPISDGYARFLENLRYFMKDSRWDTDEKLEAFLGVEPGYISEFGSHGDRFEELIVIDSICNNLGVPWSVLAFSNVAKEDRLARLTFEVEKAKEALGLLIDKRNELASELNIKEIDARIDMTVRPTVTYCNQALKDFIEYANDHINS